MADAGMLVVPAPHLPFLDPHKGRAPGLFALDPLEWVEVDGAFAAQMRYRAELLAAEGEAVAAARPGSREAVAEVLGLLVEHLVASHGYRAEVGAVIRPDEVRVRLDGVGALALLAQEDWLLLRPPPDESGEYTLEAGVLLFPAGWSLADKLGRPLTQIHHPVPSYAETLSRRVNRVFAALHPDRPLQRLNYSVAGTAELHCPVARSQHRRDGPTPYLRVERQTLRRLPRTGWVVFGVKTYLTPLSALTADQRAALAVAYSGHSPEMAAYRRSAAFPAAEIAGAPSS